MSGYSIEVITVGSVSIFNDTLFLDNFTGNGTLTDYTLSTTPASENAIDVYLNGIYQNKDTFTLSSNTLTFSTAPTSGTAIEVKSTGGLNNVVTSSGGGISWQTTPKTAAFTATAGEGYFVNTTSAAITVTLPSSPTAGDEVSIVDYAGTADTNNITITSSDNINGASDDVLINYERGGVSMVYVDSTQGWIAYNAANETAEALINIPNTLTVDYLVVAGGGGGGGYISGGGGAGGLRTSYGTTSGGGGSAESPLLISFNTNYTVEVGPGGSPGAVGGSASTPGSDSIFASITSIGGGGGATTTVPNPSGTGFSGGNGGSGGGNRAYNSGAAVGQGTANQGYDGATGTSSGGYGGGGGGAGGPGTNTVLNSYQIAGGPGLAVSITGSSVTYAAGGHGGREVSYVSPTDAANNTGDGGNGKPDGTISGQSGAAGGSGIVVLRYPNSYTITETTSGGNVLSFITDDITVPGTKITTFTAGANGTIQFS